MERFTDDPDLIWDYVGKFTKTYEWDSEEYSYAFYNPFWDKMWCFSVPSYNMPFIEGEMVNLSELSFWNASFIKQTVADEPGQFIGHEDHPAHKLMKVLRDIHKSGKKHKINESVWVF